MNLLRPAILCIGIILPASVDATFDLGRHPTPEIARPPYRTPTQDATFGYWVTRVTDSGKKVLNPRNDPTLENQVWGDASGHGYSAQAAWNADERLLVMPKGVRGEVFLDGRSYEPLFRRSVPGRAVWHPTDPEAMLFVDRDDHCIGSYEVRADRVQWRRCFDGYVKFDWSDPGKGKPSVDGEIIPIRARRGSDGHWVAVLYNIDQDKLSGEIDMTLYVDEGSEPDFVMSPLGDVIIIVGCLKGHSGRCQAQIAIDVATRAELWKTVQYHVPGHADELLDEAGRQWRVGVAKEGDFRGRIIKRNFRTGRIVSLLPYWGSHTSTRNIHDPSNMIIVSYHDPSGPLQNEIVGICPEGTCIERYAQTHRFNDDRYLGETHASISPSGRYIVFRSSWGDETGAIDAYVIDLKDRSVGHAARY